MGLPSSTSLAEHEVEGEENTLPYDRNTMTHVVEVAGNRGRVRRVVRRVTLDFAQAAADSQNYDYFQAEDGPLRWTGDKPFGSHEKGWFVRGKWLQDNRNIVSDSEPLEDKFEREARERGDD